MNDHDKSKSQLIAELEELRRQVSMLQHPDIVDTSATPTMEQSKSSRQVVTHDGPTDDDGDGSALPTYTELADTLRLHEARLDEVQRVAHLGYYSFNIANNNVMRSSGLLEILGIDEDHPEDVDSWVAIIHPEQRAEMAAYLADIFERRARFDKEYRIIHGKSGQIRWVHGLGQLRLDDDGNPTELFGTIQDITEWKATEEALQKSNETYRNLIDGMNETVWVVSPELKFLDMNRTATEVMQYTREELLTMGPLDIDDALDAEMIGELGAMMPKDGVQVFETVHRTKDGRRIPVEIQSTMVSYYGEDAMLSIARDITERKETEEALRKSEETYRNIIDSMNETVWVTNFNGKFIDVNETASEMLQYSREELLNMGPIDIDLNLTEKIVRQLEGINANDRVRIFETTHTKKDGQTIPVEIQSTLVIYQGQNVILSIARDITERKEAEEALRKSEETYRNLIDNMSETVWVIDFNGKFLDVNQTACELLQYSREELLTMGPLDIDPNLTEDVMYALIQRLERERIRISETLHIRKDGTAIPVELQSTLVTYRGKEVILSIGRDITERKKAETALQRSEATNRLLAAVVRQSNESIAITDLAGRIEYINPAYEMMHREIADEIVGRPLSILLPEAPLNNDNRTPWEVLQSNETWSGRYLDRRNDGSMYDVDALLFPIYDTEGQITNYCKIARDISHEVQLERQLSQAQRLETIGTLAGGIAHDFNNMLTPVMGYAEMAASSLPPSDPLQANLQQILKGAHRARDLVRQILTFSRQHEQERQPLYLPAVIKEALKLMRPSIPSTIEIRQSIDPMCEKVLADATQIHQVIVNLCTNAFHAMEAKGGRLTITLEQVKLDPALAQLYPDLQQGEYARLAVADSGIGMDKATVERIFEPFFTTKPVDRGTGLGLSVAHGIIRAHGGALIVESEPGQGSTFQIYLPILRDEAEMDAAHSTPVERGKETILLVDDETAVTDVVQMMLDWLGYHVEAYNDSYEALTVFKLQPHKYDLVISDLTMPQMTGVDFAEKLQEVRAGMPVFIITGYGNHLDEETQRRHGIRLVASKPIALDELATQIRQVLDT